MTAYGVSALMVMFASSFGGMQRTLTANNPVKGYTAKGGNQAIPEAMANALKNEVRLNTTVVGIRSAKDGVEVSLRRRHRLSRRPGASPRCPARYCAA